MANIALVLKEEISRLARKEIRSEIDKLKKASTQYRSEIAALKRRNAALEQQMSRLGKTAAKGAQPEAQPEAKTKVRFTVKGFKTLRQRLGLTAEATGGLLGVTAQTIYNWEAGSSRPRPAQLERIAVLRGMGKREISAIVKQMKG